MRAAIVFGFFVLAVASFAVAAEVLAASEPRPVCVMSSVSTDDPVPVVATCLDGVAP